jgi:hypothetical protein
VPDTTAAQYRPELRRLEAALVAYRRFEPGGRRGRTNHNNGVAALCGLGRRIRVAVPVLQAGPITCNLCGPDFEAPQTEG